ncbi:MAG: LPS export ABC transporter periplasmic protein LptC [Cellvibrionaceae bacterium]|nr:LPS export ABC transporter periplasmic protein LptC [Cellvibrionaceae bacterium]
MLKNWFAPAILIILTLVFLMIWDTPPQNFLKPKKETSEKITYPTNILHNAVNRKYDEEGKLSSVFEAEESRHFQINPKRATAKDYTELKQPQLTLHSDSAPPWKITADSGKAKKNGTIIHLWGNVHIWQKDTQGKISELKTPYLIVKPEQQYAETSKPVMIDSLGNKTEAVGMKAFLKQDKILLLSNVRGIHEI